MMSAVALGGRNGNSGASERRDDLVLDQSDRADADELLDLVLDRHGVDMFPELVLELGRS